MLASILSACKQSFTVSFETFDGTPVAGFTVDRNTLLSERDITVPLWADYTFAGWYKDKALSKEWDFAKDKVKKNVTLYAKYVEKPSVYIFTLNEDNASYTIAANSGGGLYSTLTLPSSYKGLPITAIADNGFQLRGGIINLTIPATIKTIGKYAFNACTLLSTVKFESGSVLTFIGERAFSENKILKSVALPASLVTISDRAFYNDIILRSVTIESGSALKTIEPYAFYGCALIDTIGIKTDDTHTVMPDTLEVIDEYSFAYTAVLKSVTFSENSTLQKIGNHAFAYGGITAVSFPKTLTKLDSYAFTETKSLRSVIFDGETTGLTEIASYTFSNSVNLHTAIIPASVKTIGVSAFNNTTGLKLLVLNSLLGDGSLSSAGVFTSETIGGVTNIKKAVAVVINEGVGDDGAATDYLTTYKNRNTLYSKYFTAAGYEPEAGETQYSKILSNDFLIYTDTDAGTSSLLVYFGTGQAVDLADVTVSVDTIGDYAFYGSYLLESITIAAGANVEIGRYAFGTCVALRTAAIIGAERIGAYAFANTGITTVTLGDSLEYIGNNVFENCTSLTEVTIPDSVEFIDNYAFYGCRSLVTVNISSSSVLTDIGTYVFHDNKALRNITLPASLTSIGDSAFSGCSSLISINLPDGLTIINKFTFENCILLHEIILPDSVTTIDSYAFSGNTVLTSINIAATSLLQKIGTAAFKNASSLYTLWLPATLSIVEREAFYGTKIKVITINSLINVDDGGVPNLSQLLTISATQGTAVKDLGRVIIINAATASALYTAYKDQEAHADNDFIISYYADVLTTDNIPYIDGGNKIVKTDGLLTTLVAYFGEENNLNLNYNTIGQYALANSKISGKVTFGTNTGNIFSHAFEGCLGITEIEFTEKNPVEGTYSIWDSTFKGCVNVELATLRSIGIVYNGAFAGWLNSQKIDIYGTTKAEATANWPSWSSQCFATISYK
jgi:uncharacterized repeat protein (TIGR02543 family)